MTMVDHRWRAAVMALGLTAGLASAPAGAFEIVFGNAKTETIVSGKYWPIGEFSEVRIVSAEAGAAPNSHPASVSAQTLRQLLAAVRVKLSTGEESLFAVDELDEIVSTLSEALRLAKPDQDVFVRSSSRRGASRFTRPYAVTARLFVLGERLNLIVNDARADFFFRYRASGAMPEFTYGSRATESKTALARLGIPGPRGDWLEIPLSGEAAAPPAPRAVAPAAVAPAAAAAPAAVAPVAAPAPAPAAPAPARIRDAAFAEEVEQRLTTLKRLRDKGLITEDEYQQKRREVMSTL